MMQSRWRSHTVLSLLIATLLAVAVASPALAADEDDPSVRWDLSKIYPTDEAWQQARAALAGRHSAMDAYKGRLAESATVLSDAMDVMFDIQMDAMRLAGYASMRSDEDTRESGPQGMRQSLQAVFADLTAATAWVDPEILAIPSATIAGFVEAEPRLAVYRRYLERLEKRRPHVLDPHGEELLGMAGRVQGEGASIGNLLRNAEMPWPSVTLSDGTELRVDAAGYSRGRQLPNRDDRIAVYDAFYGQLQSFKGSLAATLSASIQEHIFESRARSYETSLDAALAANEVDPAVYRMLIDEINTGLPTLHRYLRLRAAILGVEDLRYHDMYPPLVDEVSADYSWENSMRLVGEALQPLGTEYVERFQKALDSRWVDVYPRIGKRSGAYVNDSSYEVHPFMLLNHQDDYLSTSTLAHEGGHLMHSWYSQEAQPFPTSNYVIFVAEVASTVNEVMLFRHLVAAAPNDNEKLAILGNFLEGLRTTVFRQTMFAEFELAIHEAAEAGDPLTGDSLNELYAGLLKTYHGHDDGVMTVDDAYVAEWAFVPHFHYNFYVYQYATSYVAAIALAEGIEEGREGALERYLTFLKAGSTAPPVDLLRNAGVDMTGPEPIRAAMRLMNDVMDQIDEIMARKGG